MIISMSAGSQAKNREKGARIPVLGIFFWRRSSEIFSWLTFFEDFGLEPLASPRRMGHNINLNNAHAIHAPV
jgi:hypothetical protein